MYIILGHVPDAKYQYPNYPKLVRVDYKYSSWYIYDAKKHTQFLQIRIYWLKSKAEKIKAKFLFDLHTTAPVIFIYAIQNENKPNEFLTFLTSLF